MYFITLPWRHYVFVARYYGDIYLRRVTMETCICVPLLWRRVSASRYHGDVYLRHELWRHVSASRYHGDVYLRHITVETCTCVTLPWRCVSASRYYGDMYLHHVTMETCVCVTLPWGRVYASRYHGDYVTLPWKDSVSGHISILASVLLRQEYFRFFSVFS